MFHFQWFEDLTGWMHLHFASLSLMSFRISQKSRHFTRLPAESLWCWFPAFAVILPPTQSLTMSWWSWMMGSKYLHTHLISSYMEVYEYLRDMMEVNEKNDRLDMWCWCFEIFVINFLQLMCFPWVFDLWLALSPVKSRIFWWLWYLREEAGEISNKDSTYISQTVWWFHNFLNFIWLSKKLDFKKDSSMK